MRRPAATPTIAEGFHREEAAGRAASSLFAIIYDDSLVGVALQTGLQRQRCYGKTAEAPIAYGKLAGKADFAEYGAASRGLHDRDPDGSMCRGTAAMVITGKYWSIVLTLCGASVAAVAAQQALAGGPTGFESPTPALRPGRRRA